MKQEILPLILTNQNIGQRHYFDCYETAFGGLTAYYSKNFSLVRDLYSTLDCFSLILDEDKKIILNSRAIDINGLTREILGLALLPFTNYEDFSNINKKDNPFVITFDEFYVHENNHYGKTHFSHASLGLEIIDKQKIKIIDPGLEITKPVGYSADERIISFNEQIYNDKEGIIFFTIKENKNTPVDSNSGIEQKKVIESLEKLNIGLWKNNLKQKLEVENFYYGFKALEIFTESLTNFSKVEYAASEFYKWIFPIYWKHYYLNNNRDESSETIIELLLTIIKEMEIFETNLLRLKAMYKVELHNSSIKRWDKIVSLFHKYIEKEEKRILKNEG